MNPKRHIAKALLEIAGSQKSPGAIRMGSFVGLENIPLSASLCDRLAREGMRGEVFDLPLPTFGGFRDDRQSFRTPERSPRIEELDQLLGLGIRGEDQRAIMGHLAQMIQLDQHQRDPRRHWHELPNDEAGYVRACCQLSQNLAEVLRTPLPYWVSSSSLKIHQLILGGSGSGKSEAMLHQVHQLTASKAGAVVVIDPHADLAKACARLRVHGSEEGLAYLCPSIEGFFPSLNPFQIADRSPQMVDRHTEFLIDALAQIIGTEFTQQMQSVLSACISTLLLREGSKLSCLARFLDRSNNQDLLNFAIENHYSRADVDFLLHDFQKRGSFTTTVVGLRARLLQILGSHSLSHILDVEKSSFDIQKILLSGRSLIVSIPQGEMGQKSSHVLGCFIVAMLQYFGLQQYNKAQEERKKVFLFLDEAHLFMSPSLNQILSTSRKYGLHLCGATQHLSGSSLDSQTVQAFRENTAVRIFGDGSIEARSAKAKMLGVREEALSGLSAGLFVIRTRDARHATRIKIESRLVERSSNDFLSEEEWSERLRRQRALYYREAKQEERGSGPEGPQIVTESQEALMMNPEPLEDPKATVEPPRAIEDQRGKRPPPRKARKAEPLALPAPKKGKRGKRVPWSPDMTTKGGEE